ncbi:hypothetical protein [Neptunomonas qingdaonensis]|uniref:Uncharacterized protein n=1 Tax=Neptunomonas qingdaonensis TaxID=1045558 RepID=A0A1I2Q781_9GAMM|nr:hypothetical protein [Neptunomonas qingdaonensis]SFG24335.1 hypothetical protein SAMN05216175_104280 [Neptunomonas qingdaonensis]
MEKQLGQDSSDRQENENVSRGYRNLSLAIERPRILLHSEIQQREIYDLLFLEIDDDKWGYDSEIKKLQECPDTLLNKCIDKPDQSGFVLNFPEKSYDDYIERQKLACLKHIAFQDIVIGDLIKIYEHSLKPVLTAPPPALTLLSEWDEGLFYLMRSFASVSEHLTALRMIKKREQSSQDRAKGGKAKNLGLHRNEKYLLIKTLVKILLHNEHFRTHLGTRNELIDLYVKHIMMFWDQWPFFHFDKAELQGIVTDILSDQGVIKILKRSLFERGRRVPMLRPPNVCRSHNDLMEDRQKWQEGLISALKLILETKFDEVSDQHLTRINSASPEEIRIWLCRTLKAKTVDESLIQIFNRPPNPS